MPPLLKKNILVYERDRDRQRMYRGVCVHAHAHTCVIAHICWSTSKIPNFSPSTVDSRGQTQAVRFVYPTLYPRSLLSSPVDLQ